MAVLIFVIVLWCIAILTATTVCTLCAIDDFKSKKGAFVCIVIGGIIAIFGVVVTIDNFKSSCKKENNLSSSDYSTEQTFYYQMTATAVNENTFITEDGNMWRMKNINIEKGKKYQLTFDNHDTEIITDDEIVDFIELNEKVD
jgi:hypothetical protein